GVFGFPADSVLWRPDRLRAPALHAAGDRARDREEHAIVRFRIRASSRPGPRRLPNLVRTYHPRTVWNDRDDHEYLESVRRRAQGGKRRISAAGSAGAHRG